MPLLAKLLSFNALKAPTKKKHKNPYIRYNVDPYTEWEKIGELGDGAFGKVYKVRNKITGIIAAAKSIDIESDEDFEDLTVEIDILSECKHLYLVGLYETYYHDNKICMMIEYCSGGAIDNVMIDLDRNLNENEIKVICRQVLEVLQSLHAKYVIHRDLKAGNILLTEEGIIKLADFGVSAYCKSSQERRNTHIGTPYWMSPEVIACETDKQSMYNTQADIWSLGITLIELAESQPPYAEMQPTRVLFKIIRADPPSLSFTTKWSTNFHDFLSKCLVKDSSSRQTAQQLLKHPFLAGTEDASPLKRLFQLSKGAKNIEISTLPEISENGGEGSNNSPKSSRLTVDDQYSDSASLSSFTDNEFDDNRSMSDLDTVDDAKAVNQANDKGNNVESIPVETNETHVTEIANETTENNNSVNDNRNNDNQLNGDSVSQSSSDGKTPSETSKEEVSNNGQYSGVICSFKPNESLLPASVSLQGITLKNKITAERRPTGSSFIYTRAMSEGHVTRMPDPDVMSTKMSHQYLTLTRVRSDKMAEISESSLSKKIISQAYAENVKKRLRDLRTASVREMRSLQQLQQKQLSNLLEKTELQIEQLEKKKVVELQMWKKKQDSDVDQLLRKHEKELNKLKSNQLIEIKIYRKKLETDQDRDVKSYKEKCKVANQTKLKELKKANPKYTKEVKKQWKQTLEAERLKLEGEYEQSKVSEIDSAIKVLQQKHGDTLQKTQLGLLKVKQATIKDLQNVKWTIEEKFIEDRANCEKQYLIDDLIMVKAHLEEKRVMELDQHKRLCQFRQEELIRKHKMERKKLPKLQRVELKNATIQFKKQLREYKSNSREYKDKLNDLLTTERKKQEAEAILIEARHKKELDAMETANQEALKELKEINEYEDTTGREIKELEASFKGQNEEVEVKEEEAF